MEVKLSSRFILVFLLVWPLIAGCTDNVLQSPGGTSSGVDAGSGGKSPVKPVTIDFWFPWGGEYKKEFKANVVDEFEKKYPNIKVNMTFVETTGNTQASDKLLTAIAASNPPDVALFDRFLIASWAFKGALTDLTGYVDASGISSSDYYDAIWKEAQYENKVYGLPWGTDNREMYYNKSLMKAAGLNPEVPPSSREELDVMAAKMFKRGLNNRYEQVGFIPWLNQGFLYTQGWNWGGSWEKNGELVPNDPQIVKAVDWMTWYAKTYDIESLDSFTHEIGQTGMNAFLTGKIGFVYDGNWLLNDLKKYSAQFDWGVAPMPAPSGKKPATWAGGWSFVIPKGAVHEKEAWEFIKFVAGKEGTLLWAKRQMDNNDITAMPAVNEELNLKGNPNLKVFLDQMPKAYTRPVTPVGSFLWNETFRIQDLAINGRGTPQELLAQLKKNVNAELAKLK
ncbi:ABC transporter substrate-binding protein [Paenibacillus sp. OV219]|uniref:ABC transporter substrate-binding protein n=1 Tax=Paenibacillus sp. OV219 TaxID=1884377 RepID=UPI0008CDDFAB|nr:ABC transporter substrate-binding protein [Paenibacillus sp. OV219]SEO19006.1 ABC-type glycerol-3-phosphate transport system, substrate-binding protein [Paenibacillus sp. OV219]